MAALKTLMTDLLQSELSTSDQVRLLQQLRIDQVTGQDLLDAVALLRPHCLLQSEPTHCLDIVGTGGDGLGLINISTATSFVLAGAGIPVAKHGNSGVSSPVGSMDCLRALGVALPADPAIIRQTLQTQGLVFLAAPLFYPVLGKIREARKQLAQQGVKTLFNLVGPLLNPLRPTHQLVGVMKPMLIQPMAEALQGLGRQAYVFCCANTDELLPIRDQQIVHVSPRGVQAVNPQLLWGDLNDALGAPLPTDTAEHAFMHALQGGAPIDNAERIRTLLQQPVQEPLLSTIVYNALLGVMLFTDSSPTEALDTAFRSVLEGAALAKYQQATGATP